MTNDQQLEDKIEQYESTSPQQWLTLKEASEFLGVHFTTLRTWADNGKIRVFRTPGGHQRFSLTDLRRFLDEQERRMIVTNTDGLVDAVVGRVRQQIANLPETNEHWHYQLSEDEAATRRQRGRKLFSLAITYVLKPAQRERILADGRKLGIEYGWEAALSNVGLSETGRAVQFFRNQLSQTLRNEENSGPVDADDVRIQGLIDQFLDEVLYAVLEGYEQALS